MNRFDRRKRRAQLRLRSPTVVTMTPNEHIVGGHGEQVLRLVAETNKVPLQVVGTAFIAGVGLAITAAHNIEEVFSILGLDPSSINEPVSDKGIKLYQVTRNREYVVWDVTSTCHWKGVDLALLEIQVGRCSGSPPDGWALPMLMVHPPVESTGVTAIGYRKSTLDVKTNEGGEAVHIDLNDQAMLAKGHVTKIYPERRDSLFLPFPCFEVNVRYHSGLSGGPVMDHVTGSVCGVVCSSFDDGKDSAQATSYASTLWPLLAASITKGRYPTLSKVDQPILLDLALSNGGLRLSGVENLDPKHFPGREMHIEKIKSLALHRT
jgi:Trypsin-like peptidase domain